MKNILSILIILLLFSSCSNKKKELNNEELCEILIEMDLSDQKYRRMSEMSDSFFEVLDSLQSANNLTLENYAKLPKEKQVEFGKKARLIVDKKPKVPQHIKDSLINLQVKIDNRNTEKLIDLVKINGWPSLSEKGFRCEETVGPAIIFRHSQEKYWNDIQSLIDNELKQKRISQGEYNLIDNHLKGRPSFNFKKANEK